MSSRSKQVKLRNNNGTRCYTKGGKFKCKGYYMYSSTDRRRLNKIKIED